MLFTFPCSSIGGFSILPFLDPEMKSILALHSPLALSPPLCNFLLLFILSISWLASYCDGACDVFICGDHVFNYPFGKKNSGCGDPTLQLECDEDLKMPLLNISGTQYYILRPWGYLEGISNHSMIIIDADIIRKDQCDLFPSMYAQFWYSSQFHIADGYQHIHLGKQCHQSDPYLAPNTINNILCNEHHYTNSTEGNVVCESVIDLPVKDLRKPLNESLQAGLEITWRASKYCVDCNKSKRTCDYRKTPSFCYCSGTSYQNKCSNGKPKAAVIIGSSIACGLALVAGIALFLVFRVKRRKSPATRGLPNDFNKYQRKDTEAGLTRCMKGNLPIFPYEELEQATNFFDEKNELGDGGFGSVYLGKLKDGRTVAVKRLYQDNSRRVEQFINEINIFSSVDHPNLVRLYGYTCPESPVLLLVYEFLPNGTLADHLHGNRRRPKGLNWGTRLNIAIETAQALAFLHSVDPPIFHRDVKTNNILLDENLTAKVADFGLSRLVPVNVSHVTTAPQGTPGYLDPEYHQCYQLTEKSDVYSFGVVLVEIISAKLAVDITRKRNEISLANMAIEKIKSGALQELVDPHLEIEMYPQIKFMVSAVSELALECLANERDVRPGMREVAARLEEIKQLQTDSALEHSELSEESAMFKRVTPFSPTSVQEKWPSRASDKSG